MSCRVASTNRSCGGARLTSSSSCRHAWSEPSSCRSSSTSHSRSRTGTRSLSNRSAIAQPSRSGAAVNGRTRADPETVWRSASSTDSHNRCGSRSSRATCTHAAYSVRPVSSIQDRSRTVFPLPAGADTTVTRTASRPPWPVPPGGGQGYGPGASRARQAARSRRVEFVTDTRVHLPTGGGPRNHLNLTMPYHPPRPQAGV
jgi:hypothetical protein